MEMEKQIDRFEAGVFELLGRFSNMVFTKANRIKIPTYLVLR
jgi:hypothetical protein